MSVHLLLTAHFLCSMEISLFSFIIFYQGDSKMDFNPTCYRTEAQYSHMTTTVQVTEPKEGQTFGFDIVLKRRVQTYVEVETFESY